MPIRYEPPFPFQDWKRTEERHFGEAKEPRMSDWVPHQNDIPPGPSPQAVRVIREGRPTVTLRLLTTQAYRIGRNTNSHLWFPDTAVSRLQGLLYFAPEISGWAFRDPMSTLGTFIYRFDQRKDRREVPQEKPIGIAAGQTLEFAGGANRLEFLERVPPEVPGASARGGWRSRAAQALEQSVQDAARKLGPVVLFGPSGSGKTFLAQRIHELSGRKGPYVELNCGRVPKDSTQFQSELLGHVKGAYTGAVIRRVGALFQADGGTLFLDEVESLPSEAQVFLLDLLEGTAS